MSSEIEKPGDHFTWKEFACPDGTEYPPEWRETRGVVLGKELDRIRDRIGAFSPTSVFRTFLYHKQIYSRMRPPQPAPVGSQHLFGRAADVPKPVRMEWLEFHTEVLGAAAEKDSQIRYIKFYRNRGFAHVDCRQTTKLLVEYATP